MYVGMIRLSPPESAQTYTNTDNLIFGLSHTMRSYDPSTVRFGEDGKWDKQGKVWHKVQDLEVVPLIDDQGVGMKAVFAPDLSVDSFLFMAKDFTTLWRGFGSLKVSNSTLRVSKGGDIAFYTREYKSVGNSAKWLFKNPLEKMRQGQTGLRGSLHSKGVYCVVSAAAHVGSVPGAATIHGSSVALGAVQGLAKTLRKVPLRRVSSDDPSRFGGVFN